ncbi:hypothetical protein EST38_g12588 [Candolleomyces aberdarensis]|uniref:Pheromone receptor n=1 Tax=Candolleomyces aberdarensis TaxID=2316362 RepID=A0A4Q2D220_9AGAR|nr:hypothetical protein EST38_g12588 [Candolleomyces aberdarensis]
MPAEATYPLFPIFCLLGFIFSVIPLPWHLQAWNSGTVYFMMWSALACLNLFINSIVWADNVRNSAPIWCEISIRIMLAASVGIPASSLCINRRLYKIANAQSVAISRVEKIKGLLVDTSICVLFPLVYLVMVYVVQGHRYDILEQFGCFPAIYNTIPTYFLSTMWPLVIGTISACYCIATLRAFNQRRLEFSSFLRSNQSALTFSRYFRLMALAMTDILVTTPLSIFTIWLNATATPIAPYISWEDTHFNYGRVERIPAILWRNSGVAAVGIDFSRWITPVCALVFFAFFGFADEAQRNYKKAWIWVTKPFRRASPPSGFVSDNKEKLRSFG